jgi:hypothetical protein
MRIQFPQIAFVLCIWEVLGSNLAPRPKVLSDVFRGCPLSLQVNDEIMPYIMPRSIPYILFLINFSVIILSFDVIKSGPLKASLNKP